MTFTRNCIEYPTRNEPDDHTAQVMNHWSYAPLPLI